MSVSTSVHPILEAAEQAAAAGDVAAAGELLRRALQLQETDLGPHHPDLANTLNNLGVVCEKTGRLDEAEHCYRRAYEIAAAAFEPDHPFVITSRKNLAEFGEAHGRAIEPLPATALAASAPAARPEVVPPPPMQPPRRQDVPPASKHRQLQIALLAIGLIAVLVLGVIVMRRSNPTPASTPPDPPPAATTPVESAPARDAAVNSTTAAAPSKEAARPGSARGAAQPTVAEAQVCRRFSATGSPDWRCDPAGSSVAPGSLVYYTRIKAPKATTVEHRWYHGDDLQQRVVLDVAANPTAGYRTYSRLAVSAAGRWRVELRTTGGTVLHEERFNVR
jgi:hypothetical protein